MQSDVGNKSMENLDAADKKDVGESMGTKENNKEPDVDTSAAPDSQLKPIVITPEKCDVITEQVQVEEDKRDVSESEKREVIQEKCDVTTPAQDDSCSSRAEKKTGSSDSYDSETEDTTTESSSQEVQQTTTDKRDEKVM